MLNYQRVQVFFWVIEWSSCLAHRSWKAASVNLLTRKIRVPVPSMRQLDKAAVWCDGPSHWTEMGQVSVLRSFLLWPLNPWFLLVKYSGQSRGPDQAMVKPWSNHGQAPDRQCLLWQQKELCLIAWKSGGVTRVTAENSMDCGFALWSRDCWNPVSYTAGEGSTTHVICLLIL